MGKPRRSAEERRRLLAERRRSGMTRREFCEHYQIPLTTLDFWVRAEGKRGKRQLIAVKVQPTAGSTRPASQGFTVALSNGRRIESSWGFSEADLVSLIRAAERA